MASYVRETIVELAAGTLIDKHLRLVRKLGEGGMGTVWVAEHLTLHTQVVVKFIHPEAAAHVPNVARFRQEAALAAQVRHPHVVQVYDHGVTDDGVPFIVMELLEGRSLGVELNERNRLPPGEVSAIFAQAAKALHRVHEAGFVHRDVKPENIFLCELGTGEIFVKLLDFGIAKARTDGASALTSTGITMGTPCYMSPEQIVSARDSDAQADLWALAVVAYEALTGVRPFDGETVGAVALALHAERRPRPSDIVPFLPPELDGWFARAFARDIGERFPDARTMARALGAIIPPTRSSLAPSEPPRSGVVTSRRDAVTLPVASVVTQTADGIMVPTRQAGRLRAIGLAAVAATALVVALLFARGAPTPTAAAPGNAGEVAAPRPAESTTPAVTPAAPSVAEPTAQPSQVAVAVATVPPPAPTAAPASTVVAPKPKAKPTPKKALPGKDFDDVQ